MESSNKNVKAFRNIFILLGIVTFISVFLYGIGSIVQMPEVSPDGFIPKSLEDAPKPDTWLALLSPVFVLLYALSFIPVVLLFTIAKFRINPYAMTIAVSLIVVSLLVEIMNALPMISFMLTHAQMPAISPELVLYLKQNDAIRFLAYDVAGFTLAYMGLFIYSLVFSKTNPWLSRLVWISIILFIANVPFLWILPFMAVVLMGISIIAFSIIPLIMVRIVVKSELLNKI